MISTLAKSIAQFQPLAGQRRGVADRHYDRVHTPFARAVLREMPHVISYHTNRAHAEFDISGGWAQRPRAFRFVILRFTPGRSLEFPPGIRARIAEDHRNFLREFRGFAVDEETVLDRLAGQTALVKYLVEYEAPQPLVPPEAEAEIARLRAALAAAADRPAHYGLRQVLLNRVRSEAISEPIDEPGQRTTDRPLPETTKVAFAELYFDARDRAEEWFGQPAARAAVLGTGDWALARATRVVEECGFDRR